MSAGLTYKNDENPATEYQLDRMAGEYLNVVEADPAAKDKVTTGMPARDREIAVGLLRLALRAFEMEMGA